VCVCLAPSLDGARLNSHTHTPEEREMACFFYFLPLLLILQLNEFRFLSPVFVCFIIKHDGIYFFFRNYYFSCVFPLFRI